MAVLMGFWWWGAWTLLDIFTAAPLVRKVERHTQAYRYQSIRIGVATALVVSVTATMIAYSIGFDKKRL